MPNDPAQNVVGAPESDDRTPPVVRVSPEESFRPLRFLLVVEVKQTDAGRTANVIDDAMKRVKIDRGEEREVDEPLVAAIAEQRRKAATVRSASSVERLMLLEAPAKKIDLLINSTCNGSKRS